MTPISKPACHDREQLDSRALGPTEQTGIRPFLRWAGSKQKLLPRLSNFWHPKYKRYVEPFAGSSCLFFSIQPPSALLADTNSALIETYLTVRENPTEIYDRVIAIPRTSETYYKWRKWRPEGLSRLDRAVRFIYLNRNCFNGLYRTNLEGEFNVPFAATRAGNFLTREQFLATANLLKRAELRAWDFGTTLRYVKSGDFVYLDPPYSVASRRVFREYGATLFGDEALARLKGHLARIHDKGVSFLVSYADCKESRELAVGWTSKRVRVRRHIAGFSGSRRQSYELLITNIDTSGDR